MTGKRREPDTDPEPNSRQERDFGDSAGYGTGGSATDYEEVVGTDEPRSKKPNPLDAIVRPPK